MWGFCRFIYFLCVFFVCLGYYDYFHYFGIDNCFYCTAKAIVVCSVYGRIVKKPSQHSGT